MAQTVVQISGHIIDSLILPKVLDLIISLSAEFEILDIQVGHRRSDRSHARIKVEASSPDLLDTVLAKFREHGELPEQVEEESLQLEAATYNQWPKVEQLYSTLLDSIRRQPGIEGVGAVNALVLEPGWRIAFDVEGRPAPRADERPIAQHVTASDGYFETFRARLVRGRFFTAADTHTAEPAIVINETLARQVFPGEDPVGRRLLSTAQQIGPLGRNLMWRADGSHRAPFVIVGVVADVHQGSIGQPAEPVIYHTHRQFPFRAMTLVARGPDTAAVVSAMRTAVRNLDASLPLSQVKTMEARIVTATAAPRLLTAVLTTFAVLTGLLAAIGVYGLLAWTVNERRHELAIRLALGAQPWSLATSIARQGFVLAGAGVVLGLVGAQLGGRVLRAVLFQTNTLDLPAATGTATLLLTAAAT